MATAKQRAWRAKFASMYGGKKRSKRSSRKGGTMAKRKYSRRRRGGGFGGFSTGRLLTVKNAAFTVGGATLAPRFGMDAKIGGAVGGYLGAGLMGAVVGYFIAEPASNALSGVMGGGSTASSGDNW